MMTAMELEREYLAQVMHASATEVFATMLGNEIQPGQQIVPEALQTVDFGIMSLLGLTGEWTGSGGLCCSAPCACWMASQMMFSEYPEVNDEVRDAVGEVTNMVIGGFKNAISEKTGPLAMSTPTVVFGREMTTSNKGAHEWIVFPFTAGEHSFRMIVQLHPVNGKQGTVQRAERPMIAVEI